MSALTDWVEAPERERQAARVRLATELQRQDDAARYDTLGADPCPHTKDALGSCTGPCAGEEWDR